MADPTRVGVVVPNLFLRVPVDAAVRGVGAEPVGLAEPGEATARGCRVVVVDLDAVGSTALDAVSRLTAAGVVVLAFGPHVDAARLAAARSAGAVALPRSAFLRRLPDLLTTAVETAER